MSEEVTKKILKEMEQMSKGGEGSGQKGHRTLSETTSSEERALARANREMNEPGWHKIARREINH